ncbi:MAG: hydantoinase/oxoprolinase family protein, partial [Solirubrobacteraceae bacterium]
MLLGVDVGGTFTDAVLALGEEIVTAKAPTTPDDQSRGVIAAVQAALEEAGRSAGEVTRFCHGTTVATNALLEGNVARTAFVCTEGFTDLVALGRQNRPELYRLCVARPAPLVPEELRFPAAERMTPDGPLRPLSEDAAREVAERVAQSGAESVAVALLHSYRNPEHERLLAEDLRKRIPDVHVSLSSEVVGTFREFERASTTEVDAALSPLLGDYLRQLTLRSDELGLPEPSVMQSNGGLIDAEAAAGHASWTVLSGPAGGAAGAAFLARATGTERALCLDMGGTSCDVCLVDGGAVREQSSGEIGGRPLALPMLAVQTVGAGGGSIAWRDPGGALRVGPKSAGADPGPACYGRGGTEPTVTDANLLLGRLSAESPLAGGVRLDLGAAERAIDGLAASLELPPDRCAEGILRVAVAEMVRAVRVVTVRRGVDPRDYALLAFGGAGPLHAAQIAQELGMRRVLCPRASGVLAALGLIVSQRRRDAQRSVFLSGEALTREAVADVVAELAAAAREALGEPDADVEMVYELRYRGQSFELPIQAGPDPTPDQLRQAFEAEHERQYGYADSAQSLELVTIRVSALTPGTDVALAKSADLGEATATRRPAVFGGRQVEVEVIRGAPAPDSRIRGPAVIELPDSTVVVPPDWTAEVDATGTIVL